MSGSAFRRVVAALVLSTAIFQYAAARPAAAAQYVVFKIWNNARVPVTQIYDKESSQGFWGVNDLSHPLTTAHFFYIRFEENAYSHCPMFHDVKLVFANGTVKEFTKIDACKYDIHVNRV